MLADEKTLEALDFSRVRDRVTGVARTQRGRRFAAAMIPATAFAEIGGEQRRTNAARDLIASADLHVRAAIDTAELTQVAALGRTLGPVDLRAVADALAAAAAAYNAVRSDAELSQVTAGYLPLRDLYNAIADGIDERGTVLDRASPALGRIRRSLSQAQNDARDRVGAILRSARFAKAIQDQVVTIREGRFVVPVKAEFAGEFPGIVHDSSASGQTLFIEPLSALETNNRVRTLRIEEEREVQRVLEAFSARVGDNATAIEGNVEILARLDLIVAKAEIARSMNAIAPILSEEPLVAIYDGRHPLLGERAVTQSLELGERTHVLVISGPNMGGKTVALKMVGLFVAMTYCGMQLPAAPGTAIGWFDRVVADIGDEQSIADNASTFSAHLQRMRDILTNAGGRTLALVDEIGGGTEPGAGAALAIAMLERLLSVGARAVVTTHATELKLFAHATAGVSNASVRFDPATFRPTFHLDVGAPGQSLAFPLAHTIGLDDAIVARAQHLLDNRERDYETALAELSMRTAELQGERSALAQERRTAAASAEALVRERSALERERAEFAAKADERMRRALREFASELQQRAQSAPARPKVSPSQVALLSRTLDEMHRDLGIVPADASPEERRAYGRGAPVEILSLGQNGEVVEDYGDTLLLAIGPMKTVVSKSDVRAVGAPAQSRRVRSRAGDAGIETVANSSAQLDVRGKRFVEAEPLVERWIDDALLSGIASLRLVHGKGTGMLGRGLQEYLRSHPAVTGVRYGNEEEGSAGVSIVSLRE